MKPSNRHESGNNNATGNEKVLTCKVKITLDNKRLKAFWFYKPFPS